MPSKAVGLEITASLGLFRFNEAEMIRLLQSPTGGVCRDLVKRGIRVEAAAKQIASSPPPSSPGHGPAVRTGRLRGSITWRLGADGFSPFVDVGTAVFYGPFVEEGTSRMAARPFLRPALQFARATF